MSTARSDNLFGPLSLGVVPKRDKSFDRICDPVTLQPSDQIYHCGMTRQNHPLITQMDSQKGL